MAGGETQAHRTLKELAFGWAAEAGFTIAAAEVRVPRTGFRADVAGYLRARRGSSARTAIFECKQARPDLIRDTYSEEATRRELDDLVNRRAGLEKLLGEHRPDLRRGESLFPEFDAFDFTGLRHETYSAIVDAVAARQRRLFGGTKFERLRRYAAADFLYLVAEDNLLAESEVPSGWGLLARRNGQLVLLRRPLLLQSDPSQRILLLESIAAAATRMARVGVRHGCRS